MNSELAERAVAALESIAASLSVLIEDEMVASGMTMPGPGPNEPPPEPPPPPPPEGG